MAGSNWPRGQLPFVALVLLTFDTRSLCDPISVRTNSTATNASSTLSELSVSPSHDAGYYVAAGLGLQETTPTQVSVDGEQMGKSPSTIETAALRFNGTSSTTVAWDSTNYQGGAGCSSSDCRYRSPVATSAEMDTHQPHGQLHANSTWLYAATNAAALTHSKNRTGTGPTSRQQSQNHTRGPGTNAAASTGYSFRSSLGNLRNITGADACWTQWTDYWAAPTDGYSFVISEFSTTDTLIGIITRTTTVWTSTPKTYTVTNTSVESNGPWAVATQTSFHTYSETSWPATTMEIATGFTQTFAWEDMSYLSTYTITPPTAPLCQLPSSYSSCQQAWEGWASTKLEEQLALLEEPSCTQAALSQTGSLCSQLIQSAATDWEWLWGTWPTSSYVAPGCNLGCGKCAITGGTVELLYFPPGLMPATEGPVIATTLNTTLTSPTVYVSLASVHASNGCGGVGPTKAATIIPVPEHQLSSSWQTVGRDTLGPEPYDYACSVVSGVASFNLQDLQYDPVPYSVYESQPYCASITMSADYCKAECPTTLPYRPIIVLHSSILNGLDPLWQDCFLDIRGLYDPPKALTPVNVAAGPSMTAPDAFTTISATPASNAELAVPSNTSPIVSQVQSTNAPVTPENVAASAKSSPLPKSGTSSLRQATSAQASQGTSPASAHSIRTRTEQPSMGTVRVSTQAGSSSQTGPTAATDQDGVSDPGSKPFERPAVTLSMDQPDPIAILSSALDSFGPRTSLGNIPSSTRGSDDTWSSPSAKAAVPATMPMESAGSTEALVVNEQIMRKGSAGTVGGQLISVGAGKILIAGSTIDAPTGLSTAIIAGQTFTMGPARTRPLDAKPTITIVVNGQVVAQDRPTNIDGQLVSIDKGYLAIAGTSFSIPSAATTVTAAGQAYAIAPDRSGLRVGSASSPPSALIINEQLVHLGETTTIDGKVVSVDSGLAIIGGNTVLGDGAVFTAVVGGQNFVVEPARSIPLDSASRGSSNQATKAVVIDPDLTIIATGGQPVVVGSQTIKAGGPPITAAGHVFSKLDTHIIIDGSRTIDLDPAVDWQNGNGESRIAASTVIATIGGKTFTVVEDASGRYAIVDGTKVAVTGLGMVIGGQTVSAVPSGVQIGTQLSSEEAAFAKNTVIGGHTFTIMGDPSGQTALVDGQLLAVGGSAVVIDGQVITAVPNGIRVGETFVAMAYNARTGATTVSADSKLYTVQEDPSGRYAFVDGIKISVGGLAFVVDGETVTAVPGGVKIGSSFVTGLVPTWTEAGGGPISAGAATGTHGASGPAQTGRTNDLEDLSSGTGTLAISFWTVLGICTTFGALVW